MGKETSSQGKCVFCEKSFSKTSMVRHLNKHLEEKVNGNPKGLSFHIKIESNPRWGNSNYFLNLWVDGNTTLQKIDTFLRLIWLECCGHSSSFQFPRQRNVSPMNFFQTLAKGHHRELGEFGEIPMNRKAKDIFHKDLKLEYEYDFGSTTKLQVTVLANYGIAATQQLVLLSRNEPLALMCGYCGLKPAAQMCSVCMSNAEGLFCNACAKKHAKKCEDFAEYAAIRVANSPRMGVCGYDGGTIDMERDGVFMKKDS
jgi:hypothetical protein